MPSSDEIRANLAKMGINVQGEIEVKGKFVEGDQHNTIIMTSEQQQKLKADIAGIDQGDQATILGILRSGNYPEEITLRDYVMGGRVKIGDVSYRIVNEDIDNAEGSKFRYRRQK